MRWLIRTESPTDCVVYCQNDMLLQIGCVIAFFAAPGATTHVLHHPQDPEQGNGGIRRLHLLQEVHATTDEGRLQTRCDVHDVAAFCNVMKEHVFC